MQRMHENDMVGKKGQGGRNSNEQQRSLQYILILCILSEHEKNAPVVTGIVVDQIKKHDRERDGWGILNSYDVEDQ